MQPGEWPLSDTAFQKVAAFGSPQIDLFASRWNAKRSAFVSWSTDPDSFTVDAFTLNWNKFFFFVFQNFAIILCALQKIYMDKGEGILVVPFWPSLPCFCLSLFTANPFFLHPILVAPSEDT